MPIGQLAMSRGLLNPLSVNRILEKQNGCRERFGELAVNMGILERQDVENLLHMQENNFTQVGELFVACGLVEKDRMEIALKEFLAEREKLKNTAKDAP